MNKWKVTLEIVVAAPDRKTVWAFSRDLIAKHLRDLATVTTVSMQPLPDPDEWIAINEPIKASR